VFVKRTSRRNTTLRLVGWQIGADVSRDRNAFVFEVHLSTFFRLLGPDDGGNTILRNVGIYRLTWHNIPEGLHLQQHYWQTLKSL
jgi:hypothetical protein